MSELYHHGVKGQKWGVRRYQYANDFYKNNKNYRKSKALVDKYDMTS